ncbi:MAG: hypothetical protein NTY30_04840 [Candidatus Berkelbacteria bacterium]|nr:hypothetical protein [Candidatus Berkelbacteria bacterium]
MPDKYICDCGYSSEAFAENCPMCGAMMMTIDGEDDVEDPKSAEKYDDDDVDEADPEISAVSQRKTA